MLAAGGVLVVAGALITGRAVLRHTPPAVAAASAATQVRTAARPERDVAPESGSGFRGRPTRPGGRWQELT